MSGAVMRRFQSRNQALFPHVLTNLLTFHVWFSYPKVYRWSLFNAESI